MSFTSVAELGERICTDLGMNEPDYKRADDETLIVLAPQDQPPLRFTIAERLATMGKTLSVVKIQ